MSASQALSVTFDQVPTEAVEQFRTGLAGMSLSATDVGYDEARKVQNGMIDRYPGLIVRCRGVADVIDAVNFARDHNLDLSVRGGGHNVAGKAVNDKGIVIDLSEMRAVRVDPVAKTVRAEGGATWADLDRNTQAFGLVVPGGVVSSTGIGGLTLHGGLGHVRRKHGMSIDNLLSVDVVTADGQLLTANEAMNSDLYWAMRGAGSNFGVATSLEFRAHDVGPIVHLAAPFYALEEGESVVRRWRDFIQTAPDDVSAILLFWSGPEVEPFPEEIHRRPVVVAAAVYAGDPDEGERVMSPLRELGTPLFDLSGPIPWTALQQAFDPFFPAGDRYYWKSMFIDDLSDGAIATMVESAKKRPSPLSDQLIWHLGGAMSEVTPTATPYYRRDAQFLFNAEASSWTSPVTDDDAIAWVRETLANLEPYSQGGSYINFAGLGEDHEATLRGSFGPNYERLVELKAKYDPGNLFRMNLNISPA